MSPEVLRNTLTAAMLLAAMVLACVVGRTQRAGVAILALLSLVWLTVDRDWEGPLLFAVGERHGVVLADLVGLAGLAVAAWLTLRRR